MKLMDERIRNSPGVPNSAEFRKACRNSQNITELKLKYMDSIYELDEDIRRFLTLDEKVILDNLSLYGIKFKSKKSGAIVKQKQIKNYNLSYRIINIGENWNLAGEWIKFFIQLGKFIQREKEIELFINYLNREIPALLIALGIVKQYYESLNSKDIGDFSDATDNFNKGDEINILYDDEKWYRGTVIGVEDLKGLDRFNPYLKVKGKFNSGQELIYCIKHQEWSKRVRFSEIVKGSPGRSQRVYLNDRFSEVVSIRYSQKLSNWLKMHSEINVNLIGWGVENQIKDLMKTVQFSDGKGSYLFTDYLYLDSDKETNYANIHMISGPNTSVNKDKSCPSIFLGASNSLKFPKHKTNKNIYLTNRIRQNYVEETKRLLNHLKQHSKTSRKEREFKLNTLKNYLESNDTKIPKGVELYVF